MNAGAVFRRGAVVDRPAPRTGRALHRHLQALREHGFDAAPVPVGLTPDGRELLTFITGEVALPPFPRWAMTEPALRSVGDPAGLDAPARLRILADGYGLSERERVELPGVVEQTTETCRPVGLSQYFHIAE